MVRTHRGFAGKISESHRLVRIGGDQADDVGDPPRFSAGRRPQLRRGAGEVAEHRASQPQRQFIEHDAVARIPCGLGCGDQRQQRRHRRQMRCIEAGPADARHRGSDGLEPIGLEPERETTVADAVLVAALVRLSVIAEQQRARSEHRGAVAGAIAERARGDCGNARRLMPLFVRAVVRAGGADEIVHAPAVAGRDGTGGEAHALRIAIFPKRRRPGRT